MLNEIKQDAEQRMLKSMESLQSELAKLRTGRAHPSLLDHVMVSAYGKDTPLSQVASVTISDPRTLTVTPWDKSVAASVEKAIRASELGLNPASSGHVIRVPLPALTEERRRDLIKVVKHEGENAKVSVRNIRRDAMNTLKDLLKEKQITEDEDKRSQDVVQKLTDKFIAEVDKLLAVKEKELLEV